MEPRIETLSKTTVIGMKMIMSFANNRTAELWRTFMPRRRELQNAIGPELYSVEVYNNPTFFEKFNPANEFEKWAAVKAHADDSVPDGMHTLTIPEGLYAVFPYKGKPSQAQSVYQFIYATWIPGSIYQLDNRPHFALMGEKYKGEHPDSEEEFWIPIKKR